MNPQKNQGAEESTLLRDLQAEVSSESAPMLQFMLRHAGAIAGFLILFVAVLAGTGIWRWYSTSKADEARQELAGILQRQGPDQVKALTALAEKAPARVLFSVYMALGQSAMSNGDAATAANAFGKAAAHYDGALGFAAAMGQAGALLKAGKNAEALTLLQKLQSDLPGEVPTTQLRQMTAEAALANGQPEEAARLYLALSREVQGLNSEYFRSRARMLAPRLVEQNTAGDAAQGSASPAAEPETGAGAEKAPSTPEAK